MQGILDVLNSIGEFFKSVVDFVVTLVNDLIYVVSLVTSTIGKIPNYLSFLPSAIVSIFIVALGVIVVYKIIGRD